MRLTHDNNKSQRNQDERGLPFDLAEMFDWSDALIIEDLRKDYGERRFQAQDGGDLHMLVFTP